jgi:hypothetical protein
VLIYRFSIHNAEGSDREATRRMALADDNAARAFGKAMMQDMRRRDTPRYAGWTMDVAKGHASGLQHSLSPGTNPTRCTWRWYGVCHGNFSDQAARRSYCRE